MGKLKYIVICVCLLLASLTACQQEDNSTENTKECKKELFAMDTYMSLTAYGDNCDQAMDAAVEEIERLDDLFSVGNENSEVTIANQTGTIVFSEDSAAVFETAMDVYNSTEGAFDVTIYPLMEEWGFTTEDYKIPSEARIKELLGNVGMSKIEYNESTKTITLPEGVMIDFGGIAKGYTSKRVTEIFEQYKVTGSLISLGGNVQGYGTKPDGSDYIVGIQDPFGSETYVGKLTIHNKAVITSGGYERYFEQDGNTYHHILDPKTGYPANSGLKSVTIISEDGTKADALSTAIFVMGKDRAVTYWKENNDFDMVLVDDQGQIFITSGIEGNFQSDNDYSVIE